MPLRSESMLHPSPAASRWSLQSDQLPLQVSLGQHWTAQALPPHTMAATRLCLQQGFAMTMEARRYKHHTSCQGETIMSFTDTVTALTCRDSISGFPEGRAFSAVFIFAEWHVWHTGAVSWFPAVTGLSCSKRANNTWHRNKTSALLSSCWASFFNATCTGNSYLGWQKPGLQKTTSQLGEVSGKIFLKFWTSSVSEVQLLWKTLCTEDWFCCTHTGCCTPQI